MAHIAERITTHYGGIAFAYEVTTCADIRLLGARARRDATADPLRRAADVREDPQRGAGRARRRSRSRRGVRAGARGRRARRGASRARRGAVRASWPREYERVDAESLRPARQLLGLDELRIAVDRGRADPGRGAPVLPRAGVPLSELYGLSESTGPMTWDPVRVKPGTVGRADPGHGGAARRRRRGARPRRQRLPRLPRRSRAHRRGARRRRLAPHRRHRRRSTTRATCASSTARRSSSSPPAARTSRRRTSRPR